MQQRTPHSLGLRLPEPPTTLVGREDDVARVLGLLASPGCRLVTLLGPGGVGKTRLAIETARAVSLRRSGPVHFVPLEAVHSAQRFPAAVADSLGVRESGAEDIGAHLLSFLRQRELLLVLDNFEHILDAAGFVAAMLEAVPGVKLLVTSREALNLQSEWRYSVQGLPVIGDSLNHEAGPAVQLFAQRAGQVSSHFSLVQERREAERICRLVGGMPLAIELAASWTASLSCREIAQELEANLDLLVTEMRDVPSRHRSMQAVFEQSWRGLTEEQRNVYRRLSVFSGGFDREAATQVAGADLPTLSALVDRSLIWRDAQGRYHLHELLRQYAEAKLVESGADLAETRTRHASYYLQFVRARADELRGGRQREANLQIKAEMSNIRAACRWGTEHEDPRTLAEVVFALALSYEYTSRYLEGYQLVTGMVQRLRRRRQTPDVLLAIAESLVDVGWLAIRVGRMDEARRALEECRELLAGLAVPPAGERSVEALGALGVIALVEGDYDRAEQLAQEALALCEECRHPRCVELACYLMTRTKEEQGRHEAARGYALRAYEAAQAGGDRWFMAYCLNELGTIDAAKGDLASAERYYRASYDLRRELDDPEGMAVALNRLGSLALKHGQPREADDLYRRSLAIYRDLDDRGGLAESLRGLAESAAAMGRPAEASHSFQEAFRLAAPMGFVPLTLALLTGTANLLAGLGRPARAASLLEAVLSHPGADDDTVRRAERILQECRGRLPAKRRQDPASPGAGRPDLDAIVATAEAELIAVRDYRDVRDVEHALVEPLTEREMEVLRCIADGLSNRRIAEELIVSLGTVKAHTHSIYGKLGAANRVQAVERARSLGILPT